MPQKVAVVIPTYNYGQYIAEAIDSILHQTLAPVEVVVVDDGSTDNTAEIVVHFGDRIKYIRQDNAGVSAARNRGVKESSAELIAFLDADDIWEPTKLEKQVARFAGDSEVGLVHCGMREFDSETGRTIAWHLDGGEGWVANDLLLWEKRTVVGPGGTIVVSREAFEGSGGFDSQMKVSEDLDLCYRIAKRHKFAFVPEPLVNYRSHSAAAHLNVEEMERGMTEFYRKAFMADPPDPKLRRRIYGNLDKVMAGSYFYAGSYGKFFLRAVKSAWRRPETIGYFLSFPLRRFSRNQHDQDLHG
jgi:glycosyltransferase involved in cell wall biosynthesis